MYIYSCLSEAKQDHALYICLDGHVDGFEDQYLMLTDRAWNATYQGGSRLFSDGIYKQLGDGRSIKQLEAALYIYIYIWVGVSNMWLL